MSASWYDVVESVFEWVLMIAPIIALVLWVGLLLFGWDSPPRAGKRRPGDPPGDAPDDARRQGSPPAHRPMRMFRK
jgi:hypothetical protein